MQRPCRSSSWRSRSSYCCSSPHPRGGGPGMRSRLTLRFLALGYLALLLAAPVILVSYRTFEHGFAPAWDAVTTPEAIHAFWLTILMVIVAVPLNTIFG